MRQRKAIAASQIGGPMQLERWMVGFEDSAYLLLAANAALRHRVIFALFVQK